MAATGDRRRAGRGAGAVWLAALVAALMALTPAAPRADDVSVDAQVSSHSVEVGGSVTLVVTVHGSNRDVLDPRFDIPPGLDVGTSGRSSSFSWINGRSSTEVSFRYELSPRTAGTFVVGPISVKVGDQSYICPAFRLTALQGGPSPGAAPGAPAGEPRGPAPASLVVEVSPRDPYVGQPALLRVRLVQRAPLAEDPRYSPPGTPGFWAERPSEPESYYNNAPSGRVLVTETRTRIYPLAAGVQNVGSASAALVIDAGAGPFDPFGWFGGGSRRQVEIQSPEVQVPVRALPPGAPDAFNGAVGELTATWSVDRATTPQDQPITVRLDLRGSGNLPLVKTPDFRPSGFEVFGGSVDDSLGAAGTLLPGRRSFRWTVVPRSLGRLSLPPPAVAWFDPHAAAYRSAGLAPIALEVTKGSGPAAPSTSGYPDAFGEHPLDPFARPARPGLAAVAGALLALGVALLRSRRRTGAAADGAAERQARIAALRAARDEALWAEAERAATWLEQRGRPLPEIRGQIAAARYGGQLTNPEAVRAAVMAALRAAPDPGRPGWLKPMAGIVALLAAVAVGVLAAPRGGSDSGRTRAAAAEQHARVGDRTEAETAWRGLWRDGARAPGLAARLAWCRLENEDVAAASLWVLRGEREDGRDPALDDAKRSVREAGGLAGTGSRALPVRRLEWAALALAAGLLAGFLWPRRLAVALAALVLVASGVAVPLHGMILDRRDEAVVMRNARLGGSDLDLEPGRVVRVSGRQGGQVKVWVGPGIEGWVADGVLRAVGSLP